MWKLAKCIDTSMLERAQSVCDTVQRITGYTKFTISKWLLILAVLFLTLGVLMSIPGLPLTATIGFYSMLALYSYAVYLGVHQIEREERFFHRNGKLLYPSFFGQNVSLRGMFVSCSAAFALLCCYFFTIGDGVRQGFFVGTFLSCILFVYVEASVPRPPSKSRFKEWVKKKVEEWSPRRLFPT